MSQRVSLNAPLERTPAPPALRKAGYRRHAHSSCDGAPVIFLPELGAPGEGQKLLTITDGQLDGESSAGAYIIDPALYPEEIAAPLATWAADMTGQGQSAFLATYDSREALDTPSDEESARNAVADEPASAAWKEWRERVRSDSTLPH